LRREPLRRDERVSWMISEGFCPRLPELRLLGARKRRSYLKRISFSDSEWRLDRREGEAWFEPECDCEGDGWALGITYSYAEQSHYGKVHGERA
jgi:hypothetical protein